MAQSVLVFVSHSSEDKENYIEPIINDLQDCYINVWIDKRRIVPGENLRKSIFRDGLDKADVALIFFTEKSLKSSWVNSEIKHVLREETKKGNDFDINKIISIFDSKETYEAIADKYPELTDNLLHLMPYNYDKVQLGQLVSAIWAKYLSLQSGDVEIQKQLLAKDREIFQKDKDLQELKIKLENAQVNNKDNSKEELFESYLNSGKLDDFIKAKENVIGRFGINITSLGNSTNAIAFGLIEHIGSGYLLSQKGKDFFEWYVLNKE